MRTGHGAGLRAFVFGLAAALALVLVLASSHHHASRVELHNCGVCAAVMDELPSAGGLPPPVVRTFVHSYPLFLAVAYACAYRRPTLMPPSCGPPA